MKLIPCCLISAVENALQQRPQLLGESEFSCVILLLLLN